MKYLVLLIALAATVLTQGTPDPVDESLVEPFGVYPGVLSTTQPGSCQGNASINIPCYCPPTKTDFIAVIEDFNWRGSINGSAFHFDTNTSDQSLITRFRRIEAAIVAFQNLNNTNDTTPGRGCPGRAAAPHFIDLHEELSAEVRAINDTAVGME